MTFKQFRAEKQRKSKGRKRDIEGQHEEQRVVPGLNEVEPHVPCLEPEHAPASVNHSFTKQQSEGTLSSSSVPAHVPTPTPASPENNHKSKKQSQRRRVVEFLYPRRSSQSNISAAPLLFEFAKKKGKIEGRQSSTLTSTNMRTKIIAKEGTKTNGTIDDIWNLQRAQPGKTPVQQGNRASGGEEEHISLPSPVEEVHKEQGRKSNAIPENGTDGAVPPRGNGELLSSKNSLTKSVEDAVRDKFGCRPRSNSTDGELNLPRRGLCDEHMVLESHRWHSNSSLFSLSKAPPRGLINLGNTCFLNATLQCLAYLPTFCQCIIGMLPPKNSSNSNYAKASTSSGQKITHMLTELLKKVHNSKQSTAPIAPRDIVNAITALGGGGSSGGHKFRPGRQEDAHEFLVHLLDVMKDGELKAAGIDPRASGWRDRLPIPRLDETTLIHRVFGGYFRSQVKCTICGYKSNVYDPFMDLALEVSKKSCNSVEAAFSEFTRKETLDEANRWKCSGCKKRVCATKQLTVFRPPLSLCIQLKRFAFKVGGDSAIYGVFSYNNIKKGGRSRGYGSARMGRGSKVTKSVQFPLSLQLPLSDGRKCDYSLTGMVVHVGGSASSGHYTSYVNKPSSACGQGLWYHMDDSYVRKVPESEVLRQKDAYVLFYCRKEVKIEFPAPPVRSSMSTKEAQELGRARRAKKKSEAAVSGVTRKKREISTAFFDIQSPSSQDDSTSHEQSSPVEIMVRPNVKLLSEVGSGIQQKIISERLPSRNTEKSSSNSGRIEEEPVTIVASIGEENGLGCSSSSLLSAQIGETSSPLFLARHNDEERQKKDACNQREMRDNGELVYQQRTKKSDFEASRSSGESGDKSNSTIAKNGDSSDENNEDLSSSRSLNGGRGSAREALSSTPRRSPSSKATIAVDRGGHEGRVEVAAGKKKQGTPWKAVSVIHKTNNERTELLGNFTVDRWGEDEETPTADVLPVEKGNNLADFARSSGLAQMKKREKKRKRKMHLDRWEVTLDEGKAKKVKSRKINNQLPAATSGTTSQNQFHRIQVSMLRMNKGRKGFRATTTHTPSSRSLKK